ncbi:WhiB family transcription factor [Mycobacterium phage LeMond]|uniref:WhiB family transcription factor n=1 Tax=Mycobacterium phage KiSi TaxID=2507856 RepID=A0A410TBQ2_9CAUD|nr:WhiB family transcription factor [Mycobacterium phage KiSi]AYR01120.1 WhiB family transcription factor [Mycobacterium phage LeMond]QAU06473.1 WhiB family transcription factor [Mycobacterium phage KiSi]
MNFQALPADLAPAALCAQSDPDVFFPDKGQSAEPARRICRRCPILDECLDTALGNEHEVFGIWGGLTQRDRRDIRRGTKPRPERREVAA